MIDCDVCQGRKTIRMPVYSRMVTFEEEPDRMPELMQSYRDYPCPECAEQIPYTRLAVIRETSYVELEQSGVLDAAKILEIQRSQAAHMMVDKILRDDLMVVEVVPTVRGKQTRLTLGIVSPRHVAEFEERVAQRQFEIADAAVDQAVEEIANWGSFYHGRMGGRVDASQAVEWLRTALKKLKAKYGKQ